VARIYIETYGCQMNEYDSELVRSILLENGHVFTLAVDEAEVIMLNTCAVRENAFNKIYARVGDLKYYRDNKKTRVGILGCMAQNIKDDLMKNRNIDFAAGPDNYRDLPKLISESLDPEGTLDSVTILSKDETYSDVNPDRSDSSVNAWLAVMRGCDNFCTFCVVPYTRGRERSRTLESVVEETRKAVASGKKQVTLLGQNVNSYRSGEHQFAHLMEAVAQVEGLERVRFTSPHPMDFPEELLRVIAKYPKLCKQIHLPLQAGSTEVLKRMNRGYTREEYLEVVARIRSIIPQAHISTDIIIGFPGETEEQFEETVEVMNLVRFDSAYIFKYSPREGTLAKRRFPDDVEEAEKTRRIVKLNDLQKIHTLESLQKFQGQICDVLIERDRTQLSEQQCQGRTDQGVMVVLPQDGSIKVGDLVPVVISGHTTHVLMGQLAQVALN
jgi:tRNA-2-methylthio-N6-dimethylallyladenosine synthase